MLYRLGFSSLPHAAWQNIRYSMQFFFLFNSISFHLSVAFASHLLGYEMQWGITSKVRAVLLYLLATILWLPTAAYVMHSPEDALRQSSPSVQEVIASNFFKELRFTFSQYRTMYCLFTFFTVMMVRPPGPQCTWCQQSLNMRRVQSSQALVALYLRKFTAEWMPKPGLA